ncbi:c-type cytochrome [Thiocapsa rosea]|uniref:Cytochrome c553 n=1 Tax=Thiocapsa rosea TaxID=69360 RepID=A0A495VED1_9GAMM|nr:c-type cytochrome [Thiocapsa rosea]RKT47170.1 cytochrome c553 [Thiocapsa rosea]
MRSIIKAAMLGVTLTLPAAVTQTASSDDRVDGQVRAWAASCAACHGTDGRAQKGMIALAGRDHEELYVALLEFKSGDRPATVMDQHAKGYTDDELAALAAWFAAQPKD